MPVNEALQALGSWSLQLKVNTPLRVTSKLGFYGHVAVTPAREDVNIAGDAILDSARYVGVLRSINNGGAGLTIGGAGMAFWLGDEDDKAATVYETLKSYTAATFTSVVTDLLPTSVQAGSITSIAGTYTNTHQYQSPRAAITYVCESFGAEWRVTGRAKLDAGLVSVLYPTTPRAAVIRRGAGSSSLIKALEGGAELDTDVQDFTTRVVLMASNQDTTIGFGHADINPVNNPYFDMFGNHLASVRMASSSDTTLSTADARATLELNQFIAPNDKVTVNSTSHEVEGTLAVGEPVWCYDPDAGLYDLGNELPWQGDVINPAQLRVTELSWPVTAGCGVYFRQSDGTWLDLTDYVTAETGDTTVTVGGYNRALVTTNDESVPVRLSVQPAPNTSVPAAPAFTVPFAQATYQSPVTGTTRAEVNLAWARPLNIDSSVITDGDHYEIRYRTTTQPLSPVTHSQMAVYTHAALSAQPNSQPIPITTGTWDIRTVGWDLTTLTLLELTPGINYEIQIRAVDNALTANASVWSASQFITSLADTQPPSTPAAPTVAGNRVAIEVRHDLGRATGGTFNLEQDLNHLEVHVQYEPNYEPISTSIASGGTMVGKLRASSAEITGQIPVVGTFGVENTTAIYVKVVAVDAAGNRSRPSAAAQVTALLIDSAHISDLTASKITAGTITSQIVQAGDFATAPAGSYPRVGFDLNGLYAYNAGGQKTFSAASATGATDIVGTLQVGPGIATDATVYVKTGPDNINPTKNIPVIELHPTADPAKTDILSRPNTSDDDGSVINTFEINTHDSAGLTNGYYQKTWPLGSWQSFRDTDSVPRGGRLLLYRGTSGAIIGYQDNTMDAFYQVDALGHHTLKGTFTTSHPISGLGALFINKVDIAAGFGSINIGYSATMASQMIIQASVVDFAGTDEVSIVAQTSTSFSVGYSNARAVTIYFTAMRV